jgi:CO/xanthine dehydrogenase Mo-binding subunit
LEAQLDTAAKELGIDPMEIRLKNALVEGDSIAVGQKPKAVSIKPCLEKVAQAVNYVPGKPPKSKLERYAKGRGISALLYTSSILNNPNPSAAVVILKTDGSVVVQTGSTDIGQGSKTVLAQMAAEVLGVPLYEVTVTTADTMTTPYDQITASSRITWVAGNAVVRAAREVRQILTECAAKLMEEPTEDLEFAEGKIFVHGSVDKFITIAEVARHIFQKKGEVVAGKGLFAPPQVPMDHETGQGEPTPCYIFGATVADVEVDQETGLVTIIDLTTCYDSGKTINPLLLEGQVEGGVMQGIGFTLMEDMYPQYPSENPAAFDLKTYLIPTAADVPQKVQSLFYESNFQMGPFGAKGLSEGSTNTVAPAIVNAIYDAVGVRIKNLPITPERLLRAMREQKESSK